jgi:large subunit ribosomal protein L7A
MKFWGCCDMISLDQNHKLRVGIKQTTRALMGGSAVCLIIAEDAEQKVINPIVELAKETGVTIEFVATMDELGKRCKIDVGAAAAVIIK